MNGGECPTSPATWFNLAETMWLGMFYLVWFGGRQGAHRRMFILAPPPLNFHSSSLTYICTHVSYMSFSRGAGPAYTSVSWTEQHGCRTRPTSGAGRRGNCGSCFNEIESLTPAFADNDVRMRLHRWATFAETAILNYRLSFAAQGKQTLFSDSVCSKQTKVAVFQ